MLRIRTQACARTVLSSAKASLSWLLSLLLVMGMALTAQERFGELQGTVTDASGAAIPRVKVTVTNTDSGRLFETQREPQADYVARNLEPGRYKVRFEAAGLRGP